MDHCQQGAMASLMCEEHEVRISEKNKKQWGRILGGREWVFGGFRVFFGKISVVLKDFTPAGYPSFHFARWVAIQACGLGAPTGGLLAVQNQMAVWKLGRWFYFHSIKSNIPWDEGCYPAWNLFFLSSISPKSLDRFRRTDGFFKHIERLMDASKRTPLSNTDTHSGNTQTVNMNFTWFFTVTNF